MNVTSSSKKLEVYDEIKPECAPVTVTLAANSSQKALSHNSSGSVKSNPYYMAVPMHTQ